MSDKKELTPDTLIAHRCRCCNLVFGIKLKYVGQGVCSFCLNNENIISIVNTITFAHHEDVASLASEYLRYDEYLEDIER